MLHYLLLFGILTGWVRSAEPLMVRESTVLDPNRTYGAIVIAASGITLDGAGASLVGDGQKGDPRTFVGTGITLKGVTGVTVKNLKARGWETGLRIEASQGCVIEACNFSDNFHDPEFGWGEQGRRGGIVLENSAGCILRRNQANHVWDACVLFQSKQNRIEGNDFSHTSNTCLKLWNACDNRVEGNNLSYGIRIKSGEVHARDSTSVLIESGSNDNIFLKNDCTHGGDGIFIRVLNGWVSTGNVFTENDCSYANNNCVEAWSPRNTWIRNKANHGSYGFWLGASDENILVENEASFNGLPSGNHNSPHLPENSHAGIVFMFGPSSHTLLRGNRCVGNQGAGIAAIGDQASQGKKWRAFHWILGQNICEDNRWGIYLQHADEITLADNHFKGNRVAGVFQAGDVQGLRSLNVPPPEGGEPPEAILTGAKLVSVGEAMTWSAAGSSSPVKLPLNFRWSLRSGIAEASPPVDAAGAAFTHTFTKPGFYRLALTVDDTMMADLASLGIYVVEPVTEAGTEGNAAAWSWVDPQSQVKFSDDPEHHLQGSSSLHAEVNPYSGGRVTLRYTFPLPAPALAGRTHLVCWIRTRNEGSPAWQDMNPLITLNGPDGRKTQLTPASDFLSQLPYNEAREGWAYFAVPAGGSADWKKTGDDLTSIQSIDLGFDSWGAPPLQIWIDGLGFR